MQDRIEFLNAPMTEVVFVDRIKPVEVVKEVSRTVLWLFWVGVAIGILLCLLVLIVFQ